MMKLCVRSLSRNLVAASLIVMSGSSRIQAQGSFPPPIPTNPFTDAQGHKYNITFVDVVNVVASPGDPNVIPGPALATHTTSLTVSINGVPTPYNTTTQAAFTDTPHSSSQQGTLMGNPLWRIADTSIGYGGKGPNYTNYNENFYGQPVFRFKVQKLDTNSAQYVHVRIACGESGQARAAINGVAHVPILTNVSATGTLFNSSLSAMVTAGTLGVASPGYASVDDKSGQRFSDFFQNTTNFNNGVAYLLIQASPSAVVSYPGSSQFTPFSVGADSKWEFVVFSLQ